MPIDKRDWATIAILSLVFFLIATWNLGMNNVPLSTWQSSRGESFYIDLGSPKNVSAVYFLVKRGYADVKVYTGYPGSWNGEIAASIQDYYSWKKIGIDRETQFVRFVFGVSYGEIAEIAVLNGEGKRIVVNAIRAETGEDKELMRLIDEQEKVECPPTYMSETYFDEIYYVRAAEDYIKLQEPYEWTHPPLGKLIIAAGILAFGYNPFGWRIIGVTFATLMIPVMYLLGKKMFGTWIGAFVPAFLLMFDFMHFTMGRIATIDTFVVLFSLTSQFFFFTYFQDVLSKGWKASTRPLFLAILFFSLGFSAKWYVLYGFVGQVFLLLAIRLRDLFAIKKGWTARVKAFFSRPFLIVLLFLVAAVAIYLSTFIPYMVIGHTFKDVYEAQLSMYNYHSTLTATHPFSSQWWTWPLISRPVWLYVSDLPGGVVSTIAAMGNPAVWWFGFAFILLALCKTIREKNHICLFIVTIFFFQWLPYALISRTLFLYHFYFNVPLLALATAYFLNESWNRKWGKMTGMAYLIGVVILFGLFYPVISGNLAPYWWREQLKWFRSWVF